jgi:hypothetical protein
VNLKINFKTCTEEELWKFVAVHLKKSGIDTILVGGAVVSIYSDNEYRSGDLDFVLGSYFTQNLEKAMGEIGFSKKGRHYIHPDCKHLFVEFPGSAPLGIGEDYSIVPKEVKVEGVKIKILSPTDCIKDRLASFIHFKDREGLEQAILVAKNHPVKFKEIELWCKNEGASWAFIEFKEKFSKKNKT